MEKKKYDTSKVYNWEVDDKFVISGLELDALNKALFAVLNTPEAQGIMKAFAAYQATQEIIKRYVEDGIIKERVPESQEAEII